MAGGGGTRFWPLSRKQKPKQFLNLSGKDTMVMDTVNRLVQFTLPEDIFIVTNSLYREETIRETTGILHADHILGEPAARNTAACIGYAAMEIVKKYGDGIMCIVPSDHFIQKDEEYARVMKSAIQVATDTDALVTIGIRPTFPSTGYGYIRCQNRQASESSWPVAEFVEKPDRERAMEYLSSGEYSWNSGMFVWKASTILKEFSTLLPDIYEYLCKIGDTMGTEKEQQTIAQLYPVIPKISIDYGIMERAQNVRMIEGDFGWNDVGSFDALEEIYPKDEQGNVIFGTASCIDTKDCILYGSGDKLIATLGVDNLVIAQTEDVILVCDKKRAQDIKNFSELLKDKKTEKYL